MAMVVILLLFSNRIMGWEESMMIDQFGEEYRVYMKSTGRILPRLR
jgi:protein-S-isoprenylcysteine O-methyltransferase Ste14